jgi:hypothetical protein
VTTTTSTTDVDDSHVLDVETLVDLLGRLDDPGLEDVVSEALSLEL